VPREGIFLPPSRHGAPRSRQKIFGVSLYTSLTSIKRQAAPGERRGWVFFAAKSPWGAKISPEDFWGSLYTSLTSIKRQADSTTFEWGRASPSARPLMQ
jgi:hypothetical protein